MGVDVPTKITGVTRNAFLRGQPVRSGQGANDITFGLRGLNSEINHAYAYRVHTVMSVSYPNSATTEFFSDNTGGLVDIAPNVFGVHRAGAAVAGVIFLGDFEEGTVTLTVTGLGAVTTGAVVARNTATVTRTLTVAATPVAQTITYKLQATSTAPATMFKIYRMAIYEVVLAAGDMPTG